MNPRPLLILVAVETVALVVAVSTAMRGRGPVGEPAAPAVVQADGSTVLQRIPGAPASLPALPRGTTLDRAVKVSLEPLPELRGPVQLDVMTVLEPSGARRVVVAAEGGRIVGGADYAPGPQEARPPGPWAFGPMISVDPRESWKRRPGGAVAWSRGRLSVVGGIVPGQGASVAVLVRF